MHPVVACVLLTFLLAGAYPPQPLETRTILHFDGAPGEEALFSVRGQWAVERSPTLVRSGTGSLRVTLGPPEKWPGIRVTRAALEQAGYRWLRVDVYNTLGRDFVLSLRLDDAESKGAEDQLCRQQHRLVPGWNLLSVELAELRTPSGRLLDPERLALLVLHTSLPKVATDLLFDHLRFERPGGEVADVRPILQAFEKRYQVQLPFEERRALLRSLAPADVPLRIRLLGARALRHEPDVRLVEEAIRILGTTQASDAVEEALRLTEQAHGRERWRWYDALGRMAHPLARKHLWTAADKNTSSADQTAALRALARRHDASLLPLLGPEREGSWQVQVARVAALRLVVLGDAFPTLAGHLRSESARVRGDAQEALAVLSGRDLGDDPERWIAWWEVNRAALGDPGKTTHPLRSPYGSYYGLPLRPGRLCFVIDVSGSMGAPLAGEAQKHAETRPGLRERGVETRLDLAREELKLALEVLPEATAIQIIHYSTDVFIWNRAGPRLADRLAKADAFRKLNSLHAGGYTNIYGALCRAFDPDESAPFRLSFRDSVDTVYLLSDGDPTIGEIVEPAHIVAEMRDRNRARMIRINTIGMGRPNSYLLRELARLTGGTYVDLAR